MNSNKTPSYASLLSKISLIGGYTSGILIFILMLLVSAEIFARNFLGSSTMICDEMSGYLNAAIIFLGAAYTLNSKGFIRIEFLYDHVRGRSLNAIKWVNGLLAFAFLCVFNFYIWKHVLFSYSKKIVSNYFTETPLYLPQGIMGIGSLIFLFLMLGYLVNRVRNMP